VACDSAFCFYYNDNLDLLRALGAELVAFSPVADPALPPRLDGLYLGGGYPELHAPALTENAAMRSEVAEFAESGAPVYAECGGFMYLAEAIVDAQGRAWPMAGVFPTIARMQARLARLGYVEVQACGETAWPPDGVRARGHEFRYSLIDPMPETVARIYRNPAEGYKIRSTVASYIHLHFLSCPPFAKAFVDACARRRSRNSQ
jgi:cobyrinic acid a,c-diamide synthase